MQTDTAVDIAKKEMREFGRRQSDILSALGKDFFEEVLRMFGLSSTAKITEELEKMSVDSILDSAMEDLEKLEKKRKLIDDFLDDLKKTLLKVGVSVALAIL